jgi:hypothetical protein
MTLQLLHSEFPYIQYEENLILFVISVQAVENHNGYLQKLWFPWVTWGNPTYPNPVTPPPPGLGHIRDDLSGVLKSTLLMIPIINVLRYLIQEQNILPHINHKDSQRCK